MDFPYWKFILNKPKIMFEELVSQDILTETDNEANTIVVRKYPDDYMKVDHISNHFTENVRIYCQFNDYPTPIEIWEKMKDKEEIKNMRKLFQRELVYSSTKECNTFNTTYCLYIIKDLIGKNGIILDPSSGWGDRLIASLASEAETYHGFDPNKKLHKSYNRIIKMFCPKNKIKNFNVTSIPFEESNLSNNYYDLALTSPPYFDLEKYSTDNTQSTIRYNIYEDWLDGFYKPYLQKMINAVKKHGYIAIYVEDIRINKKTYPLRLFTINYMTNNNLTYYKKIGLKVGRAIRWTFIWKK